MLQSRVQATSEESGRVSSASHQYPSTATSYDGLILTSAFQPIFSIAHRRPVGYEGLLRAYDTQGQPLTPAQVFKRPLNNRQQLELDRTCRRLHAQNFASQDSDSSWLFLNLNSQCLANQQPDAGFMRDLMAKTGIPARRIVIEILESEINDRAYLRRLIEHFRGLGCLIAIDDFGAGHSNFDRIWELKPDIVKIDRNLVKQASTSMKVERILTGIVSLIHETGSLVVIEGIETEKEALVAIACNADMAQGFYFGMPESSFSQHQFGKKMDALLAQKDSINGQYQREVHQQFELFRKRYEREVELFKKHKTIEMCGDAIFEDDRAVRCFLLDQQGYQMGRSLYSPKFTTRLDLRFAPLLAGENANWSHRHYHQRALQNPGQTQISRPYLSVAGSHICVTVSQAVEVDDQTYVFCCDLDWPDEAYSLT